MSAYHIGSVLSSRHAERIENPIVKSTRPPLSNCYLGLNKCSIGNALSNRHADRYQIVICFLGTKPSLAKKCHFVKSRYQIVINEESSHIRSRSEDSSLWRPKK